MFGALIGDIVGSPYRKKGFKSMDFEFLDPQSLFTDDTVMTAATADAILNRSSFTDAYWNWGNRFPNAGYGKNFQKWLASSEKKPYFSYGNGSAMRVSPVGWAFETLEETMKAASDSASVTHDHPEGIKGAQSTASAIWLARNGKSKEEIKEYIESNFGYDLSRSIDEMRPDYVHDVSCMGTMPAVFRAFYESENYIHAIRLVISLGGDSDTLACITGSIADAFYREIPKEVCTFMRAKLPSEITDVLDQFEERYVFRK
ncbi:MAG: hypothetical protein E7029_05050 [Planctomycetaceae bacterium]|nr:hypothetical protein [Planctomycetaceae bacterium]